MIKVLSLLGSARKGGNSEILLNNVNSGISNANLAAEIETIRLSDLRINACLNCGGCDKTGNCVQMDDMQELYDKLLTYDMIILSSPIYFMGVSAWTKKLVDRCQALWVRKYRFGKLPIKPREKRKGVFLSVSGMKKPTVFDGALLTVQSFFATIHVTFVGELVYSGIDAKGDISKHPSALSDAFELGKKLILRFDDPDFRLKDDMMGLNPEHDRK